MAAIPIPVHSYRLRSRPASPERLLNCFAAELPPSAKSRIRLIRAPGIVILITVGTGPIYAMHKAFGYLWVVSGSELYRVDSSWTAVLIGNIGAVSSAQNIDIDHNADSIVVVNTPNAYYYSSGTFAQITDSDFRGASDVEFIDNWLLFTEPNTGIFYGADLGSPSSFSPLNFATAEGSPDNLVGLKTDHRQVVLPGDDTFELWEDVGGSGFPFSRAVNGFIELGCANGRTLVKCDNSVFWLANDLTVRRLDGVTPVRVSQDGIEQALSTATMSQARAWSYTQEGHIFYVLIVPEGTYIYDATTKEWHERSSYGYAYYLAGCHESFNGREVVGNSQTNQIGYLDPKTYTEWGGIQRMEWTYQPVYGENKRAFHDRLEIILETGVGTITGQGSDPQLMLECSDDGGVSFDALPARSIGMIGSTKTRVFWNNLGAADQRVYRASVTDPVAITVTDTQGNIRGGRI